MCRCTARRSGCRGRAAEPERDHHHHHEQFTDQHQHQALEERALDRLGGPMLAAGAMLTVVAETLLPEAFHKGGGIVGISTLMGFLVASLLGAVSVE